MKRKWLSLALVLVMLLTACVFAGCSSNVVPGNSPSDDTAGKSEQTVKTGNDNKDPKVKIVPAETSKIEYEDFDNGKIRLQIPKGWKVLVPRVVTYSGYSFRVYNPNRPEIGYMFSLAVSGFLKSEEARAKYYSLYPSAVFGQLAAVDPQTTEGFYSAWAHNAKFANDTQLREDFYIVTTDFEMIENLGKNALGGDILRGTYTASNGEKLQGLFTATVVDVGSYMMYGLDLAPLNSYHNIIMHAPDDEFNNWASILDYSIGTIEFTEEFMKGFNREQSTKIEVVQANAKIYDEISDMIMDSWEKRSNSYDIISQKRSDATLGYERVYDTETGDVYRAYNGFTDDYSGTRYQSITDDMYTSVISGYIEK